MPGICSGVPECRVVVFVLILVSQMQYNGGEKWGDIMCVRLVCGGPYSM